MKTKAEIEQGLAQCYCSEAHHKFSILSRQIVYARNTDNTNTTHSI